MPDSSDIRRRAETLDRQAFANFWAAVVENAQLLRSIDPNRRRPWLLSVISDLYGQQNGLCALCGQPLTYGEHHVDHIIPFCYGGGNEQSNIQLAHPKCNQQKRAQVDPHDLQRYLEDRFVNL